MGNEIGPFGWSRRLAGGNDSHEISLSQLPPKSHFLHNRTLQLAAGGCGGPQHQAFWLPVKRGVSYAFLQDFTPGRASRRSVAPTPQQHLNTDRYRSQIFPSTLLAVLSTVLPIAKPPSIKPYDL
jgi:hypothetical protein